MENLSLLVFINNDKETNGTYWWNQKNFITYYDMKNYLQSQMADLKLLPIRATN